MKYSTALLISVFSFTMFAMENHSETEVKKDEEVVKAAEGAYEMYVAPTSKPRTSSPRKNPFASFGQWLLGGNDRAEEEKKREYIVAVTASLLTQAKEQDPESYTRIKNSWTRTTEPPV